MIERDMAKPEFNFIKEEDKRFIIEFTKALENSGYTYGDTIGSGFCWGKYMLIFRKANVKSKDVAARIYIRENSIALRLFASNVTKHGGYILNAPDFIQRVFIGNYGNCKRCRGDDCKFKKSYEIAGVKYEKCNGTTFQFEKPLVEELPEYLSLFHEFYGKRTLANG